MYVGCRTPGGAPDVLDPKPWFRRYNFVSRGSLDYRIIGTPGNFIEDLSLFHSFQPERGVLPCSVVLC
ncbi:unnamed protein product [Tenebrio molitor]|nr:unnamed protein product [Tenebrio molitor]